MRNLPARLRQIRRAANLSQAQLAERSLVSLRTIARIEGGWDHPNRSTVKLLADGLGVTVEELLANGDKAKAVELRAQG